MVWKKIAQLWLVDEGASFFTRELAKAARELNITKNRKPKKTQNSILPKNTILKLKKKTFHIDVHYLLNPFVC